MPFYNNSYKNKSNSFNSLADNSDPEKYISIRTPDEHSKEIGVIEDMKQISLSIVNYNKLIGVAQCRKPVRDGNRRAPFYRGRI